MSTNGHKRGDDERERAEAAEGASAAQGSHYHSRMEAESDEPQREAARSSVGAENAGGPDEGSTPSNVRAQPPEEFTGGSIKDAKETAGGLPAVWVATKHVAREMGLIRGARTLLRLNQKDGFDCPGCAWPDPDGERSHAEFCENGAKAVAEEATTRRVTPEFFREWSVADLSRKSDFWLGKQGRITHPMVLRRGATHYEPIAWDDAFALIAGELTRSPRPTRRRSTPPAARATRRRSCTSSSSGSSARTTCPTARTCATSRAGAR